MPFLTQCKVNHHSIFALNQKLFCVQDTPQVRKSSITEKMADEFDSPNIYIRSYTITLPICFVFFCESSVTEHRFFEIVYHSTYLAQFYKLRYMISNNLFLKINFTLKMKLLPQTHLIYIYKCYGTLFSNKYLFNCFDDRLISLNLSFNLFHVSLVFIMSTRYLIINCCEISLYI